MGNQSKCVQFNPQEPSHLSLLKKYFNSDNFELSNLKYIPNLQIVPNEGNDTSDHDVEEKSFFDSKSISIMLVSGAVSSFATCILMGLGACIVMKIRQKNKDSDFPLIEN